MTGLSKDVLMRTWMTIEEAKAYAWCKAYRRCFETGHPPRREDFPLLVDQEKRPG